MSLRELNWTLIFSVSKAFVSDMESIAQGLAANNLALVELPISMDPQMKNHHLEGSRCVVKNKNDLTDYEGLAVPNARPDSFPLKLPHVEEAAVTVTEPKPVSYGLLSEVMIAIGHDTEENSLGSKN
ncbi:hypothetical protein N7539_001910 [Penicillium diatomitis]|uniref:Uncharacterized protein n=1 Tax=Penicillium diatomitis TaxID=2819901 RepID=A0A9X0C0N3_9EURO|nr:uncharacterized protein N7539_001910 [Penicillium diatomitis]KAJ5493164.1 hypothetical protein N7539_001910 [Penicillium diatomitis]